LNERGVDFASLFGDVAYGKLVAYADILAKWNRKISLTSVPDNEVMRRLIAPSAWLGMSYASEEIGVVADFGSGPGIPGIPMAIMDPNNRYLLIDSAGKKCEFIRYCVGALGLDRQKVAPLNIRLGAASQVEPIGRLVTRAAGEMLETVELWKGKTVEGAAYDFFKGADAQEEFARLREKYPQAAMNTLETPDWFESLKIARVTIVPTRKLT
jgi:16S rRNA (guanine527-N7)-methyltransferase